MSWFDAAGLASIAKSAFKEAQKTIDKALDIKEDLGSLDSSNVPIDSNSDDFFDTWGVTPTAGDIKSKVGQNKIQLAAPASTIWGSFSGSFFDAHREYNKSVSVDSLDDSIDVGNEHFSRSKLVVQQSDDGEFCNLVNDENVMDCKSSELKTIMRSESERTISESLELVSPESEILSASLSTSSSAIGLKQHSDSVEIISNSLTSPSSIEIIEGTLPNTPIGSSSLESDGDAKYKTNNSSFEKLTPDSVEMIPEDGEELSLAEDTTSYTSVSESTSATVLDNIGANFFVKNQKMLKDTFIRPESALDSLSEDPDKSFTFSEAITRAPSRSSMNLPLAVTNETTGNEVLIATQPQSNMEDVTLLLKSTNIIDIPQDDDSLQSVSSDNQMDLSNDEGSQSDKTIKFGDVIVETSGSDISSAGESNSKSTLLKNLLADAMTEKTIEKSMGFTKSDHFIDLARSDSNLSQDVSICQLEMPPRETSPTSSESRSDLVKIGSDHTSGHTSGDELETTTSSDIEIISSPNGDSSSTQSRQSPAKQICHKGKADSQVDTLLCRMTIKNAKGHTRELSEASSVSDDCHSMEIERLIRRISELTEILESRETKLIDINRRNAELQEMNNDLKHQLDMVLSKQLESQDLSQVAEEYTQRMSALEKKFQQAIREKDSLRKQLDQSKQEAAMRLSKNELELIISEKDELVKELREEGEKLSKQQLQHSNIIKKLRAKEKENETAIKHLKTKIEDLTTEGERMQRSLTAKEDVERSQIEAVNQLTTKNKKLENEMAKLQSQLDDISQKYDTARKSLDAAKKEVNDKYKISHELTTKEQMLTSLENEKKVTESQNEEVINQLKYLRSKLNENEFEYLEKEKHLKRENAELLRRLEEAETRNEELSHSVLEVSKPLLRQLESLQATHSMKMTSFEKVEQELTLKLAELQSRLHTASSSERLAKEECIDLRSKFAELDGQLSSANHQKEMHKIQLEQQRTEMQMMQRSLESKMGELRVELHIKTEKIEELMKEGSCNKSSSSEKPLKEVHKENVVSGPTDGIQDEDFIAHKSTSDSRSNSPTLSLGKASIADSLASSIWSQYESFDVGHTPRYTNMFEMQILQTNLQQREGELHQLQWELNRREHERTLLNLEISTLSTKIDELEKRVTSHDTLKSQFQEVQQQYDTLCQLYGEKVEENEELKLDLLDVKDMYKSQIDELLRQQKESIHI